MSTSSSQITLSQASPETLLRQFCDQDFSAVFKETSVKEEVKQIIVTVVTVVDACLITNLCGEEGSLSSDQIDVEDHNPSVSRNALWLLRKVLLEIPNLLFADDLHTATLSEEQNSEGLDLSHTACAKTKNTDGTTNDKHDVTSVQTPPNSSSFDVWLASKLISLLATPRYKDVHLEAVGVLDLLLEALFEETTRRDASIVRDGPAPCERHRLNWEDIFSIGKDLQTILFSRRDPEFAHPSPILPLTISIFTKAKKSANHAISNEPHYQLRLPTHQNCESILGNIARYLETNIKRNPLFLPYIASNQLWEFAWQVLERCSATTSPIMCGDFLSLAKTFCIQPEMYIPQRMMNSALCTLLHQSVSIISETGAIPTVERQIVNFALEAGELLDFLFDRLDTNVYGPEIPTILFQLLENVNFSKDVHPRLKNVILCAMCRHIRKSRTTINFSTRMITTLLQCMRNESFQIRTQECLVLVAEMERRSTPTLEKKRHRDFDNTILENASPEIRDPDDTRASKRRKLDGNINRTDVHVEVPSWSNGENLEAQIGTLGSAVIATIRGLCESLDRSGDQILGLKDYTAICTALNVLAELKFLKWLDMDNLSKLWQGIILRTRKLCDLSVVPAEDVVALGEILAMCLKTIRICFDAVSNEPWISSGSQKTVFAILSLPFLDIPMTSTASTTAAWMTTSYKSAMTPLQEILSKPPTTPANPELLAMLRTKAALALLILQGARNEDFPGWTETVIVLALQGRVHPSAKASAWKLLPEAYLNAMNRGDMSPAYCSMLSESASVSPEDDDQILLAAAENFGRFACAQSSSLISDINSRVSSAHPWRKICSVCDKPTKVPGVVEPGRDIQEGSKNIRELKHVDLDEWDRFWFLGSPSSELRVRFAFVISLRKALMHAPASVFMLTSSSTSWKCLSFVNDESAELRIAAMPIVRLFCKERPQMNLTTPGPTLDGTNSGKPSNGILILEHIKKFLKWGNPDVQASLLKTMTEMSNVVDDSVLVLILQSMIVCLGGPAELRIVAIEQIEAIARAKSRTVLQLFSVFSPELPVFVFDHLLSNPQIAEVVALLVKQSLQTFVQKNLEHVLPQIVLRRRTDLLEEISRILKTDGDVVCVECIHHILAVVFMDGEGYLQEAMSFVLSIMHSYRKDIHITMTSLMVSCSHDLVRLLAMELGDEREDRREKAITALRIVQRRLNPDQKQSEVNSEMEKNRILSGFLQQYFMGILTVINEKLLHNEEKIAVRKKIVRSLSVLMRLIGPSIHVMVAQLMTTLQTSLQDPETRTVALESWDTFARTLDASQVGPILNSIVVILGKVAHECQPVERKMVADILGYLVVDNEDALKSYYNEIGPLPNFPEFERSARTISQSRGIRTISERLEDAMKTISNQTTVVTQKTLVHLKQVLVENQSYVHSLALAETSDKLVNRLMKLLLETGVAYNGTHPEIQRLCTECVGVVGAIDPARIDVSRIEEGVVMLNNFVDREESIDFACQLIEKRLVSAFRSARDSALQHRLAFSIQELLKFCGFTTDLIVNAGSNAVSTSTSSNAAAAMGKTAVESRRARARWQMFSKSVIETVSPLVDARYSVQEIVSGTYGYPIYPTRPDFKSWVKAWTVTLIQESVGENARAVFSACSAAVKFNEINVALYLLPHIVLNVLVSGTETQRNNILMEMLAVLKDDQGPTDQRALEKCQLSTQTIFTLVDHLTKWIRLKRQFAWKKQDMARRVGRTVGAEEGIKHDVSLAFVEGILMKIPQNVMAEASYRCKAFARALMHFEQHIRLEGKTKKEGELLPFYKHLQRIYAHIDEPDGMEGISSRFPVTTLEQQILEHECAGRWTAAQTCYELSLQQGNETIEHHIGLVNCLKNLGHLETLVTHLNGLQVSHPEWNSMMNTHGVEASWRMADWTSLERCLQKPHEKTFETSLGQLLLALHNDNQTDFLTQLQNARQSVMAPLAAASMESYRRGYDLILKLHMLHEVESVFWLNRTSKKEIKTKLVSMTEGWEKRLDITIPSFKVREPLLNLRRVLLQDLRSPDKLIKLNLQGASAQLASECGRIWLRSAKTARKAGYSQTAFGAILHAAELGTPFTHIERAKWLWIKGLERRALQELQVSLLGKRPTEIVDVDALVGINVQDMNLDTTSEKFMRAKTKLLIAKWTEHTSIRDSNVILTRYREATQEHAQWEKGLFFYGRYYNTLLINEKARTKGKNSERNSWEFIFYIIKYYTQALQFGTKYIYQSLPRLLTLWLDFGAGVDNKKPTGATRGENQHMLFGKINKMVRNFAATVPAYEFLTAFPQIVSRICHRNNEVFEILETIIGSVLTVYTQQALWQMMSVSRSTYPIRAQRCNQILSKVRADPMARMGGVSVENLIQQAQKLTDQLLLLCNFPVQRNDTFLSISKEFRTLQRMVPLDLIVPLQSTLTVSLPASASTMCSFKPFPSDQPTIERFHDEVEIMHSLQKPRKITIAGSDGANYIFLCKPKDDLRKDARLMEFNSMINKLLKKDTESRRQQLHIRTYAVVPLNEECGLIEWVPNTVGLRHILTKAYRAKNYVTPASEVRALLDKTKPSRTVVFNTMLLPKFPPVFHEWFLETFPEPTRWFASRLAYARTTAVMSIIGYILGLGDRHGENILYDDTCGDCVHVDFNCLFEKGLTFEKPEQVPFRLTQNIVDAFGVTGCEGVFRKACEVSYRILRSNQESLMSVLETLIHDPLCEWSKKKPTANSSGEIVNSDAHRSLDTINRKLKGIMGTGMPLSIEGQVEELIRQATDPENLHQMYIGWAPHW